MGQQIIKQPNGRLAVWDSGCDRFIMTDATIEEIIEDRVEEHRKTITESAMRSLEMLNAGGKPYFQFTKTFEECVETIKEVQGEKSEEWEMIQELLSTETMEKTPKTD